MNFDVDPAECSQLPPFIANGVITGSGFLHGSLYTLKCQDGYSLIGQEILHCTENGTWNASFPVCLRGKSHSGPSDYFSTTFMPLLGNYSFSLYDEQRSPCNPLLFNKLSSVWIDCRLSGPTLINTKWPRQWEWLSRGIVLPF